MSELTKYWRVGHSTDETETGLHMSATYICTEWVGHVMQQSSEREILEEWCHEKFGPKVAYVQGVAACPGWTLSASTAKEFSEAMPVKWGGLYNTAHQAWLKIGRKSHRDPALVVVKESSHDKPNPKPLAALNAAEQAARERELLAKMAMVLKRCEDAVADTVDEHSHSDEGGLTLRLLHDCLDDFAALQTEEHDG